MSKKNTLADIATLFWRQTTEADEMASETLPVNVSLVDALPAVVVVVVPPPVVVVRDMAVVVVVVPPAVVVVRDPAVDEPVLAELQPVASRTAAAVNAATTRRGVFDRGRAPAPRDPSRNQQTARKEPAAKDCGGTFLPGCRPGSRCTETMEAMALRRI
jgi:hypothetical protein